MSSSLLIRRSRALRLYAGIAFAALMFFRFGSVQAADLDPKAIQIQLPDQIKWVEGAGGAANAVLFGDPSKPGLYISLTKWHPGHMSRPHFHPNDRFIYVISGTWWVGTGTKYDPASTKPIPAGSWVTHTGKGIHYDGAKEGTGDATLYIIGMGPATSTPAEVK